MLKLILGRSGTGKLYTVYRQLESLIASDHAGQLILIVPEQASFETEKFLLTKLGADGAAKVQVLSFTRLAETVFRYHGEPSGKRLDDGARLLLLSQAMSEVSDHLNLYRAQAKRTDCLEQMAMLLSQCKQAAVSADMLTALAEQVSGGMLKHKLQECGLILEAYDALLASGYVDPLDDLSAATDILREHPLFAGAQIFVDSFSGFTACEFACLEVLMAQATDMIVTLCTDTLQLNPAVIGLFDHPIRTAHKLIELANRHSIPVAKPVTLTDNHRAANEALSVLEQNLFSAEPDVWDGAVDTVKVTACANLYDESEAAARVIRSLVRGGYRYRDIAVCARNIDDYDGILDTVLERLDIPFFRDHTDDIMSDTLITLVTAALRLTCGRADADDLITVAKTGLVGIGKSSCSTLENYIFTWRIRYSQWMQEWSWNPDGMTVRENTNMEARLIHLNRLRRRIIQPIQQLASNLAGERVTGRQFAEAIYRYLQCAKADRVTAFLTAAYEKRGDHEKADRVRRVWELLIDQLDKFALLFRDTPLAKERLAELMTMSLQTVEFGKIPQTLDSVQIGSPDRMRFSQPKAVLLLGANEGVFPAYPMQNSLFSEAEQKQLALLGLELTDSTDLQFAQEQFFAYTAVSAPSERVYLFYVQTDLSGETMYPSALVRSVQMIFPEVDGIATDELPHPENEKDAFALFADHRRHPTEKTESIRQLLGEMPAYAPRMDAVERMAAHTPMQFRNPENAKTFFGTDMRLSPSKVNRFHECRFAYFCEYGLRAKPREVAELDALQFGTLAHHVMETLLPTYTAEGFDKIRKARVTEDAKAVIDTYVAEQLGGVDNKPARFAYLLTKLTATCAALLWQVVQELRQSRFVPVDYELPIGKPNEPNDPYIDPMVLTLPDGTRIRVQGTVDRVDICRIEDKSYVRVIDYKTGTKEFRLSDVMAGINLQMLIYLFSICQNGGARYGEVDPAGILYLPAKLPFIRCDRDIDDREAANNQIKAMKMNGLLLDNAEIISAMEHDAAGLFIPAQMNAAGKIDARSSIASLERFGLLKQKIEKLLYNMAKTLRDGDIAAVPTVSDGRSACDWCAFRAVCGHEPSDPTRPILRRDNQAIWDELEAEKQEVTADG